jgi:hypothetical protein
MYHSPTYEVELTIPEWSTIMQLLHAAERRIARDGTPFEWLLTEEERAKLLASIKEARKQMCETPPPKAR